VAAGELVADDLVAAVVHRRLSEHDWNFGFIIDGFPRNQPQARFFLESYDLDAVILLEVPDQLVRDRILSRRLCSRCGVDYNLISSRPATEGVCDVCGGRLVVRADDTPEVVEGRLRDYHEKTRPVLELFGAKEVIVAMDATGPVPQVQAAICEQLGVEPSSV
jgi:adenylate kinase